MLRQTTRDQFNLFRRTKRAGNIVKPTPSMAYLLLLLSFCFFFSFLSFLFLKPSNSFSHFLISAINYPLNKRLLHEYVYHYLPLLLCFILRVKKKIVEFYYFNVMKERMFRINGGLKINMECNNKPVDIVFYVSFQLSIY